VPAPRPLTSLLLLAALALGAAGCGSDEPTTTTAAAPVATATSQAGTVPPSVEEAQGSRGGATGTAPAPPASPLADYLDDPEPAPAGEARAVRAAFRAFAEAIAARDARALCARTVGFEELLRAQGAGGGSCEELFQNVGNGAAGPSDRDLELIDDAAVVADGDRATLTLGGQTPVPLRRVGAAWKVDYAAFAATPTPKD
jgi:hypothetical protein